MSKLTSNEVIASLARELMAERAKRVMFGKAIREARMHLICIGGPLNDNKLGFNKDQLMLFHRIDNCLDVGC